jgi:hypothetical protein
MSPVLAHPLGTVFSRRLAAAVQVQVLVLVVVVFVALAVSPFCFLFSTRAIEGLKL